MLARVYCVLIIFFGCLPVAFPVQAAYQGGASPSLPDYSRYQRVLSEVVGEDGVDYGKLAGLTLILDQHVQMLSLQSRVGLEELSDNEAKAFWINAFNAIVLKSVADRYPVTSVREIKGIWDTTRTPVASRQMTLDGMLEDIVRERFKDPRIFFALTRASWGSPRLRASVFEGNALDSQLDEVLTEFVNDPSKNKVLPDEGRVELSEMFQWYVEDIKDCWEPNPVLKKRFKKEVGSILSFVQRYLSPEKAGLLETAAYEVGFMPFDWTLNDRRVP